MATIEIDYQPEVDPDYCTATISLKPNSIGKDATLSVICEVDVKDSRPLNSTKVLYKKTFTTTSAAMDVKMPVRFGDAYSYWGHQIDVEIRLKLHVDDGWIFDSKAEDILPKQAFQRPAVTPRLTKALTDPKDVYSLNRSFGAIGSWNSLKIVLLVLVAAFAAGAGLVSLASYNLGGMEKAYDLFDLIETIQQRPEVAWSLLPLAPVLIALLVAAALGIPRLLRVHLRRYMTFEQQANLQIDKYRSYAVGDLVRGRSRVPLTNARLRVVACNIEKGQYRRGSGTKQRTVSFGTPVNGLLLYDETVDQIPARTEISQSFPGTVEFDDMFRQLYPPQMIGPKHGLQVHWEVQLLLEDLADQEMIGSADSTRYADFLEG
ncbi:MAG: hypothetical protein VX346_18105 [Planctomycetota bacterium]|nr:hypothetical protein [Planctomycetota bacterium]